MYKLQKEDWKCNDQLLKKLQISPHLHNNILICTEFEWITKIYSLSIITYLSVSSN